MTRQTSDLFLWEGAALFIGALHDNELHKHHAVQVCIGIDGPLDILLGDTWHQPRFVMIPANVAHKLAPSEQRLIIGLIYASTTLVQQMAKSGPILSAELPDMADLANLPVSLLQARVFLDRIMTPANPPKQPDPRILASLDYIGAHIDRRLTAADLADHTGLSQSRFQHLFSQQLGLPMRRYVLWRRIILTVDAVKSGCDLTQAAHQAGFADSAHFSRTFRQTFGLSARELFQNSRNIQVIT